MTVSKSAISRRPRMLHPSIQDPIECGPRRGSQAPRAGTFRWNMLPDNLVIQHKRLHLLINVPGVVGEIDPWNPDRLMFRALDCANEKVENARGNSASGIDQLDKA